MKALLGIDEGTSAVKAALFDLNLRPLASSRRSKQLLYPAEGRIEQDPEEVLAAVVDSVADVLAQVPEADIIACGLDHQGESVLGWDRQTGQALSPVLTWQDKRSETLLDDLDAASRAEIADLSGLPLDPYFSAGRVRWLLDQGLPDDCCIGTVDSFVCARLGAGFATDRSTASRTQLARLGASGWDERLCLIFGVGAECLPELRDSVGELGTLTHERWRQALPLRAQVVDQQAALAGTGCVIPGRAKATFGTGVFVLSYLGALIPAGTADSGLIPTVAWSCADETAYALDGGIFTAGALLDWLCSGLGMFDSTVELANAALTVDSSSGVRVLPALAGLGSPWWRPRARAVISGLTGACGREHVARAALESICHRVVDVIEAMSQVTDVTDLRIDGGMTRSPLLRQLLADYAQMPIRIADVDSTALGAAALAGVGAGIFESIEHIGELTEAVEVVLPARQTDSERMAWREFVEQAAVL